MPTENLPMRRRVVASLGALFVLLALPGPATAQEGCARAVIFTLPAVTWEMVEEFQPPNLLRIMEEGASGSMSVRTNSSRTSYASGFATIGAGTRVDGAGATGAVSAVQPGSPSTLDGFPDDLFLHEPGASGFTEIVEGTQEADYAAVPGALADALEMPMYAIGNADPGSPPTTPSGFGRWTLLAASDRAGVTTSAAVGPGLLMDDPSAPFGVRTDPVVIEDAADAMVGAGCASVVIDQGDLIRADTYGLRTRSKGIAQMKEALLAADDLLGHVDRLLDDDDLLIVVSPTSPWWDREVHLGVAIAKGPGFPPGHTLQSASTRQRSFVTLPDVAPTVLDHVGIERPASMLGRSFVPLPADGDLLSHHVFTDRESVFAHGFQAGVSTAFVIFQIVVYVLAFFLLRDRAAQISTGTKSRAIGWLRRAGLGIVAFPLSTYLASPLPANELGTPTFIAILIAIDVAVVTLVSFLTDDPLGRLLAITASTIALFIVDLTFLKMLQLNAVWGNDPIVAGRFTGLGNIAFAILGSSSLMTGALLFHRYPNRRWVLVAVAALFAVTVVVDGAPQLGSDVGGVLALVPALGITYVLLTGARPTLKIAVLAVVGTILAISLFLVVDFLRPPENRTHLARLVEDIRGRGFDAFSEAVGRKIRTNLRVFRSTIWTYLVPPALAVIAWLLFQPTGRWRELAVRYPKLRAGLIGGLLLAVLGFAANDSGIVVPAMVLSFLVPMTLLIHVVLERDLAAERDT